jgi:hypothetical protein
MAIINATSPKTMSSPMASSPSRALFGSARRAVLKDELILFDPSSATVNFCKSPPP